MLVLSFWVLGGDGPKMAWDGYFGLNRGLNDVDVGVASVSTACCGVNLAFARFWGWGGDLGIWGLGFGDLGVWGFGVWVG